MHEPPLLFKSGELKKEKEKNPSDPAARIVKVTAMMAGLMEWSNAHEWVVTTKLGKWVANKVEKVRLTCPLLHSSTPPLLHSSTLHPDPQLIAATCHSSFRFRFIPHRLSMC